MFTKEELAFLYQLLDRVTVNGPAAKAMVVQIMVKIAQEAKEEEGDTGD